jgi:hypothetical protein
MTNTRIPVDFNEWFFICATYDPLIDEDGSWDESPASWVDSDFWKNNIDLAGGGNFVYNSGMGSRCKVEVISRSDYLRARGFKI